MIAHLVAQHSQDHIRRVLPKPLSHILLLSCSITCCQYLQHLLHSVMQAAVYLHRPDMKWRHQISPLLATKGISVLNSKLEDLPAYLACVNAHHGL